MSGGLVKGLHDILVGNGWVSPLEFWQLAPGQAWWVVAAKMPKSVTEAHNSRARLYRLLKEAKAKEKMHG